MTERLDSLYAAVQVRLMRICMELALFSSNRWRHVGGELHALGCWMRD